MRIRLTNQNREPIHDATLGLQIMIPRVISWDGRIFVFSHSEVQDETKRRFYRETPVFELPFSETSSIV